MNGERTGEIVGSPRLSFEDTLKALKAVYRFGGEQDDVEEMLVGKLESFVKQDPTLVRRTVDFLLEDPDVGPSGYGVLMLSTLWHANPTEGERALRRILGEDELPGSKDDAGHFDAFTILDQVGKLIDDRQLDLETAAEFYILVLERQDRLQGT